jgi:hypothetical protein
VPDLLCKRPRAEKSSRFGRAGNAQHIVNVHVMSEHRRGVRTIDLTIRREQKQVSRHVSVEITRLQHQFAVLNDKICQASNSEISRGIMMSGEHAAWGGATRSHYEW